MSKPISVKDYYKKNSSKFKNVGIDTKGLNIHLPLWGEDVKTYQEATEYSNNLIFKEVNHYHSNKKSNLSILDLGCGCGSSLNFLLTQKTLPKNTIFNGITISEYQISATQGFLGSIVNLKCGDFQQLSSHFENVDICYAIESMVHSTDINIFLKEVNKTLLEDGIIIIIDDFVTNEINMPNKLIKDYKENWIVHGLSDIKSFTLLANKNGFKVKKSTSLTPLIKQSFKGRLAYALGLKKFSNAYLTIIGGAARQNALLKGLLDYKMVILSK